MCARSLRVVPLSAVRMRQFWVGKTWSLCTEEHLSHHAVIISSGDFLPHQRKKVPRTKATTYLFFILSAWKCLLPSQVLCPGCWTWSGIGFDLGGRFLVHIWSQWPILSRGCGLDPPWSRGAVLYTQGTGASWKGTEKVSQDFQNVIFSSYFYHLRS